MISFQTVAVELAEAATAQTVTATTAAVNAENHKD